MSITVQDIIQAIWLTNGNNLGQDAFRLLGISNERGYEMLDSTPGIAQTAFTCRPHDYNPDNSINHLRSVVGLNVLDFLKKTI